MRQTDSRSLLYKDTISPLNQGYNELLAFYSCSDTRVVYLRAFESILSLNCPNKMLWNFEEYRRLSARAPLPAKQRQRIAPEQFYNYLMVYEQIMREVGLIDQDPVDNRPVEDLDVMMMGGD